METNQRDYRNHPQTSVVEQFRSSWLLNVLGLLLLFGGSYLLFWNEGRAVKTSMALEEGLKNIVVPDRIDEVLLENGGKLVLIGGPLSVGNSLRDEYYGVFVRAVKLHKSVEVFQWKETEHTKQHTVTNADGEQVTHTDKTYSYHKDWYSHYIDSSKFHRSYGHHNPPRDMWPANSHTETNPDVRVGSFMLGPDLTSQISSFHRLPEHLLPTPAWGFIQLYRGVYYHSRSLWEPEIGDYRVEFTYAGMEGDEITMVGMQSGTEIVPYRTETGEELFILQKGLKGPEEVFMTEHYHNRTWTWIYRLLGWFPSFLGLLCLNSLLEVILDLYPGIRTVVTLGMTSIPFSVSISQTLTIIGLGWTWYRPLVGLSLLVIALLPYMLPLSRLARDGQPRRAHSD